MIIACLLLTLLKNKGDRDMRIDKHPILDFHKEKKLVFTFNGEKIEGYEGETIAAALHAAGVKVLGKSLFLHRPRGFYCAIGNCSSCLMTVNGIANVKTCVTDLEEGMIVEIQEGKGVIV
jgi:predicted molibdopterin-dependent oxidoreductase YjgC